jgi:hypothetical protein
MRNVDRTLVKMLERKRLLGRPGHRWDDIKMDLGEMGWILLAEDKDYRTSVFDERSGNPWVTERLAASEGVSSFELDVTARSAQVVLGNS